MAFTCQVGAEPIPGYQLLSRLGSGGFGEVWKCTAPGGLTKAIKIVFGHMQETRAEQELKALNRIKEVRHPFLLSLERFEILDGQLFIVTELADMSLQDRYQHYLKTGFPGIPREELLEYIRDAADVLDYLEENHDLQHLDIKPQNMLLVGGRIKIGDFGLVKKLHATSVTATGGVTPVYAAPEAFDGRVTKFSDQYSLAIVYQEMLTGLRPFPGTTALQLATQHANNPPLLDPLPLQDRPAIGRALAKIPDQRFTNCREMIRGLLLHPGKPAPAAPSSAVASPAAEAPVEPAAPMSTAQREQLLAIDTETSLKPVRIQAGNQTGLAPLRTVKHKTESTRLRPTLFLGVGGLAGATLRRLKRRLHQSLPGLSELDLLRWLYLDTDRQTLQKAREGEIGEALSVNETLHLPLHPPEHYREQSKDLLRWLDRRWLYGIPRSLLTEGIRPIGRLALFENMQSVLERLREGLRQLCSQEAKERARAATGAPLRDETPRVFLVASIAGGTGGGMFLDLAYAARQLLGELGQSADGLCGLLLFASGQQPAARELAQLNAWVALKELQHFGRPDAVFPGDPSVGLAALNTAQAPFQDCYLVHGGDQVSASESENVCELLADYLYLDTVTPAGTFLDGHRRNTFALPNQPEEDALLRTLGMAQIRFPKRPLAQRMVGLLSQSVVDGWRGATRAAHEEMDLPILACARDLEAETLAEQLKHGVESALGQDLDRFLLSALVGVAGTIPQGESAEARQQCLSQIDLALATAPSDAKPPAFQAALQRACDERRRRLNQGVSHWLEAMVETPGKRLRATERAIRWLQQSLNSARTIAQAQRSELLRQSKTLRAELVANDHVSTSAWLGLRRPPKAATAASKSFLHYGLLLCEVKFLQEVEDILAGVSKHLHDWSDALTQGRQRLDQLAVRLRGARSDAKSNPAFACPAYVIEMFPGGAAGLEAAAVEMLRRFAKELSRKFEEKLQAEVLDRVGGLWRVLNTGDCVSTEFQSELEAVAYDAILEALQDTDAAGLFLERHAQSQQLCDAILKCMSIATTRLESPPQWRHLLLGVPSSPAGATLANIVLEMMQDHAVTQFETDEDVILCLEAAHLSLQKIAASLTVGVADKLATAAPRLASRKDVTWSFEVEKAET